MILQRAWRKVAPPWFSARWISTFYEAVGAVLDTEAQRVLDGRLAAVPYAGTGADTAFLASGQPIQCQPDALPVHSGDRGIRLYPTESIPAQRYLLADWHRLHEQRGRHEGEMRHAQPYFLDRAAAGFALPQMWIVHQNNEATPAAIWHTLTPAGIYQVTRVSPSNFDLDGRSSMGARWGCFIDMTGTGYTSPATYGDGDTYGDGLLYGMGGAVPFGAYQAADVASMVVDWQAPHSWCQFVALVWQANAVGPSVTPTQDASGWWSLPAGANTWASPIDPATGLGTRPPYMEFVFDNPAP